MSHSFKSSMDFSFSSISSIFPTHKNAPRMSWVQIWEKQILKPNANTVEQIKNALTVSFHHLFHNDSTIDILQICLYRIGKQNYIIEMVGILHPYYCILLWKHTPLNHYLFWGLKKTNNWGRTNLDEYIGSFMRGSVYISSTKIEWINPNPRLEHTNIETNILLQNPSFL